MIIYNVTQGSEEWFSVRAGVISASNFAECRKIVGGLTKQQQMYVTAIKQGCSEDDALSVAGYKSRPKSEIIQRALDGERVGDYSGAAKDYAFRLAVERISGKSLDEGFQTLYMKRGNELEPYARMAHESKIMHPVEQVGFVTTPCGRFGASADGFIGDDGGAEYKCFLAPEKIRSFWLDYDPSMVMDQVQGGMWITGRKWWDICMYCPELEAAGKDLWMRRIGRDDDYIYDLEQDLIRFEQLVSEYEAKLRA